MARGWLGTAAGLLAAMAMAQAAAADDAAFTIRASTTQAVSIGATLVAGDSFCFLFSCSGSSGVILEGEAGMGGAKAAIGIGFAERGKEGMAYLALKAAVLRSWGRSPVMPSNSVFVGGELEFASPWGGTIGLLKRVDGPGWRLSAGVVRAF
jgi:hypothetical protein